MDSLCLSKGFRYLTDQNVIVNREILDLLEKNRSQKEIEVIDVSSAPSTLMQNVRKLDKLIFEVTQTCNLSCKYCTYSGHYSFERKSSDTSMTFEIAKKGFDYIFNFIKDRPKKALSIGFYGGEPFTQIDLIKEVVKYVEGLANGWDLRYTLTSNAIYIDHAILDFLREHNFSLCISIDGPREIHDAKRTYINGKGTFDDVIEKIKLIAGFDQEYFRKNVVFNAVLSKELSLEKTFEFFTETDLLNKNKMTLSFVNYRDTDYFEEHPYNPNDFVANLNEVLDAVKNKVRDGTPLKPFESAIYSDIILVSGLIHKSSKAGGGACLLGSKLFIDSNGDFHICNQINNKFSFGDVWKGYDFEKMRQMMENYLEVETKFCPDCEVRFICKRCYINFARDGEFVYDQQYCERMKRDLKDKLTEYVKFNQWLSAGKDQGNSESRKVEKFHQYVMTETGPVKTAVIDFLKSNVFHIENEVINDFKKGRYEKTERFVKAAKEEELTITVSPDTWIPDIFDLERQRSLLDKLLASESFSIEIEKGVDLEIIKEKFADFDIPVIFYYGNNEIGPVLGNTKIVSCEKDFEACVEKCRVTGRFGYIDEELYFLNTNFNSCWGKKIAITTDLKIRPCIYSRIIIGDLIRDEIMDVILKAKEYWHLTKDNVKKCKDCELRYVCFDCREIAYRKNNDLYEENPNCLYDPYSGTWEGEEK